MKRLGFNLHALLDALEEKSSAEGLTWRAVAARAGVSASTLTRINQGCNPDLESFGKLVAWLGVDAGEFFVVPDQAPQSNLRTLARLIREDSELPEGAAVDVIAIVRLAYLLATGWKP